MSEFAMILDPFLQCAAEKKGMKENMKQFNSL